MNGDIRKEVLRTDREKQVRETTENTSRIEVGGSTSNKIAGRHDMICPTAIIKLAAVCEEGSISHGDYNWANTLETQRFKRDRLNHAMRHLELYRSGDFSEDHLAKAMWGLMAALHFDNHCKCHEYHLPDKRVPNL